MNKTWLRITVGRLVVLLTIGSTGIAIADEGVEAVVNGIEDVTTATNPVTFQVDMRVRLCEGLFAIGDEVSVPGSHDGWTPGATVATDPDGDTIYVAVGTAVAGQIEYKFHDGDDWEDIPNRAFDVNPDSSNVIPVVHFNDDDACGTPSQDPIAYWPFNGNADDESGNGNHGTVFGATLTEDRFGNPISAYSFDALDDYVDVGNDSSMLLKEDMSVSLWVEMGNFPPQDDSRALIMRGEWGETEQTNQPYNVYIINSGSETNAAIHHEYGAGVSVLNISTTPLLPGNWYHIAVLRHHLLNKYSFYINGEFDSDVSYAANPTGGEDTRGYMGWSPASAWGYFDGRLDDIRIYDRVITETEILDLYNELPPDPLAQYNVCYGTTGSPDSSNAGALMTIDPVTGAGTLVGLTGIPGSSGSAVPAVAIKSTGEMYALSQTPSSDLYTVNASTGAATFVANTGLLFPRAMVFDEEDVLYASDDTENFYTVDEVTGIRTVVGPSGVLLGGLAYDPTDGTIYASSAEDSIYTVDKTTGTTTVIGPTGLGGNTPDIHFDQDGNLFGAKRGSGNEYDYISIEKTTGAGTIIGSTGFWAVIGLATRLDPPAGIPCGDISRFQSRCQSGGTIQARVILSSGAYEGEIVEFTIDDTLTYSVTVNSNQRASLSVGVFSPGNHTVALTDPPGCFDPITVRCRQSGIAMEGDFWESEESWDIPTENSLFNNFPNPFNPSTTFRYGLNEEGHVSLKIYNTLGQEVATLVDGYKNAGYHSLMWNARGVASGIYLYTMQARDFVETRKLLLLK